MTPHRTSDILRPARNFFSKIRRAKQWLSAYPVVAIKSKATIRKLNRSGKRGLFIDCGSNLGQGFDFFRRFYPPSNFDYALFEPNPHCYSRLAATMQRYSDHSFTLYQKAIGVKNERVKFYGLGDDEGGSFSLGGSTLKDHNSKFYGASSEKAIEVDSISFSDFLAEKLKRYEIIVIKMDIEGGEYSVIADLLEKKLIDNIDTLYVEFHSQYLLPAHREVYRRKEDYFRAEISKSKCSLSLWH